VCLKTEKWEIRLGVNHDSAGPRPVLLAAVSGRVPRNGYFFGAASLNSNPSLGFVAAETPAHHPHVDEAHQVFPETRFILQFLAALMDEYGFARVEFV
jgi:hypothetical protein